MMQTEDAIVEYDEIIHYDARNGYEISLEAYLKHRPECLNRLYRFGKFNWTLLIAACFYQHEGIVQMLVSQFKADVEAEGTIVFHTRDDDDDDLIEGVTPLWVAAAMNNFNIVRFLVQFGRANVNHLTAEHSTAVRAACYHGNRSMVEFLVQYGANAHQVRLNNYTNLNLAVFNGFSHLVEYLVDDVKCDLNQEDVEGRTALHSAVDNDLLSITQFLLNRGALNLRDKSRNISPLMLAAVRGKVQLVSVFDGHCSQIDWIEALELLGSVFAGCLPDLRDMDRAVEYLTRAFEARVAHNLPKLRSQRTSELFNYRQECETLDDLNRLVSFGSREHFYLEALLIQERILGTTSEFYHESLIDIGHSLTDIHQYDLCFRLWFYELDLRRQRQIPFDKEHLQSFTNLFQHLFLNDKLVVFINQFFKILKVMMETLSATQESTTFDYNLITLLHLLTIAAKLLLKERSDGSERLSLTDGQTLIKSIRSIVSKDYVTKNSGSSLLHLCCDENTKSMPVGFTYPCLSTVRVLLICGMNVDIMDAMNKTVIHVLVQNNQPNDSSEILDFLCNSANAHIDFADIHGNSAIDPPVKPTSHTFGKIQRLRKKMGIPSLKCRCARLAKYNRLDYKEHLPSSLVRFVCRH